MLGFKQKQDVEMGSSEAIRVHAATIQEKKILRRVYADFYQYFVVQRQLIAHVPGKLLEIGSGGGFLRETMPDVITSDICSDPLIDRVIFCDQLPFDERELKGIFLLNVLHHFPNPVGFFREADRCMARGGRLVMIEPHNSLFGRFIYKRIHHEPFDESIITWESSTDGDIQYSNQALPWCIFWRDREQFRSLFPRLKIMQISTHTVSCFILSGGLSWRASIPEFVYPLLFRIDKLLSEFSNIFPLFQTIILEKQ